MSKLLNIALVSSLLFSASESFATSKKPVATTSHVSENQNDAKQVQMNGEKNENVQAKKEETSDVNNAIRRVMSY